MPEKEVLAPDVGVEAVGVRGELGGEVKAVDPVAFRGGRVGVSLWEGVDCSADVKDCGGEDGGIAATWLSRISAGKSLKWRCVGCGGESTW